MSNKSANIVLFGILLSEPPRRDYQNSNKNATTGFITNQSHFHKQT